MHQYQKCKDQRVETGDVSMAREVTNVKNDPHTEMNSSEPHQAHGDSNGAHSAKREEERRRRTSRKHVCPKLTLITRSRETEKYRGKDSENTTDTRGESKVILQDITRKCKDVNCVEKKTWSGTRISSRRRSSRT